MTGINQIYACEYCRISLIDTMSVSMIYEKQLDSMKMCIGCFVKNADCLLIEKAIEKRSKAFECLLCETSVQHSSVDIAVLYFSYRTGGRDYFSMCIPCWKKHIPSKAQRRKM